MMRKPVSVLVLAMFSIAMVVLAFNVRPTRAATIVVPDDYSTIQGAINAATAGETVYIKEGTYVENVVVNKTLWLIGASREETIVDGRTTPRGNAIVVTADGVTVTNLTTANDVTGIWTASSNNMIVENNIVNSSEIGIYVNSSSNTLDGNNVSECVFQGIQLSEASGNTVKGNTIEFCHQGLAINFSSNNLVTQNTVMNNIYEGDGIFLTESPYNTLTENNITSNSHGVGLVGSNLSSFYHNNFVGNTYQVYDYAGTPPYVGVLQSGNYWDNSYPSGGNYWSDYAGPDIFSGPYQNLTGNDGIIDSPRVINEHNNDTYPLTELYVQILGDLNNDRTVDLSDAILLASAFGSEPGAPGWNARFDINHDNVIDILDVIILCENFGKTR
jgi:parallel beta-helix repeat protein